MELVPAVAMPLDDVWRLTNHERTSRGISTLGISTRLHNSAQHYAQVMHDQGWFSHTRPNGQSWIDAIVSFHWPVSAVGGENIAMGQHDASEVVKAWMESPGHRRNILDPKFRWIGIGHFGNYWVQDFGYAVK